MPGEQVGSRVGGLGSQVTVAQLALSRAKACPILSCTWPVATTTEKLEARGGTESTRRVREEGAYVQPSQFQERAQGGGSWVVGKAGQGDRQ